MKNIYLPCCFMLMFLFAKAQDTGKKIGKTYKWTFDKNSVVKDSSGRQYSVEEWQPLFKSGKYVVRPVVFENINNQFIIVKVGPHTVKAPNNDLYAAHLRPVDTSSWIKPTESTYFKTGEEIKSFSERDMDGNKLSLKNLRGKVVVLDFWFIAGASCRKVVPDLDKVAALYKNNPDVVFIALALDKSADIKTFLHDLAFYDAGFSYHIIPDARTVATNYGVKLYPTNVILDREGKVVSHWVGYAPSAPYWMKRTINESLTKKATEDKIIE